MLHGYRGSGWYDDCGYYGPDRYDGYYDSPDACSRQYGDRGESLRANLSGDQEVPKPGAPSSFGTCTPYGTSCGVESWVGDPAGAPRHRRKGDPGDGRLRGAH